MDPAAAARLHCVVPSAQPTSSPSAVEIVAHRAGNQAAAAVPAAAVADRIELDVHVLRGRVEVGHDKVIHPTTRLWERWYLLPRDSRRAPIGDVLGAVGTDTPLLVDSKCLTRRAARRVVDVLPDEQPVLASSRSWWTLGVYSARPDTPVLRSCGNRLQLWLARRLAGLGPQRGVCAHERLLTAGIVADLRRHTDLVYAWAVETTERLAELAEAGVTGVILDDVALADRA